jgi:radical SAM protein with 4Fe4S-binding SPASM domain
MNSAYSHLKALRHKDVLHAISAGKPSRLPHVELILADLCQQHCKFCAYRLDGYASNQRFDEKRLMPLDKALEIVEDCAAMGVQAIQFTGGGEPTIYPQFAQVVRRVDELGMKFSLVSNGVRITPQLAELIVRGSWVRISLDAATKETYVATRRVHRIHWEMAQEAVKHLREARDRLKTDCVIGVGFVVTPDNWKEVFKAAVLAHELGADNIRISAQFSNDDEELFAGFHGEAAELCAQAQLLTCEGFTVYNRFGDRLEDLRFKQPEDRLCGYQFFTTYIGADLQVYRCCGYAYNDRGHVGSLKDQRFKDFWMSQERFDKQMNFDGRGCERCQFRKINSALAYVLEPQAQMHEEFV